MRNTSMRIPELVYTSWLTRIYVFFTVFNKPVNLVKHCNCTLLRAKAIALRSKGNFS